MKTILVLNAFIRGFRTWLAIAMTAVSLILSPSVKAESVIDIVFDLDWTLLYNTTEAMAQAIPANVIWIDGKPYRFSDYTIQVLRALHQTPGMRISFFSGGDKRRNEKVIEALYKHLGGFKPHLVLSADDMRPTGAPANLPFRFRFNKDLAPYFNLLSTVLVDDVSEFAMFNQIRNMLFVGETYEDRPLYELGHLESPEQRKFSAPDKESWLRERHKILRVYGILMEARRRWLVPGNAMPFPDIVQAIVREEKNGLIEPVQLVPCQLFLTH